MSLEKKHISYIIILVLFLFCFVALQFLTGVRTVDSPGLNQSTFPKQFDGWESVDLEVTDIEKTFLPSDTTFVKRIYKHPEYGEIFLQVVFSGKDRRSIHQPEVCLPSQGWSVESKSKFAIDAGIPINKLVTTRIDASIGETKTSVSSGGKKVPKRKDIFVYWFMGNKRITSSYLKRIILISVDRCISGKNYKWAMVRLSAQVVSSTKNTENSLKKFVWDISPKIGLGEYKQF